MMLAGVRSKDSVLAGLTANRPTIPTMLFTTWTTSPGRMLAVRQVIHPMGRLQKKKKLEEHMRWLVKYQTSDISFTKLAEVLGLAEPEQQGRKTVTDGVTKAAELIGLTLREADRGGRPSQST